MDKLSRWYYRFPGDVYAMGPTTGSYATVREVRKMLRDSWGFKRLPRGTEVWRA